MQGNPKFVLYHQLVALPDVLSMIPLYNELGLFILVTKVTPVELLS